MRRKSKSEEQPAKLYRSISEVSAELGVKPHVLRYWETQFPSLRPKKNRAGNRMYRKEDLELLGQIKELLYDRRFTIEGARRHLLERRRGKKSAATPAEVRQSSVTVEKRVQAERQKLLDEVRSDLRELARELREERRSPVTVRG